MTDQTQVAHICERVKEYLERLPEDKWQKYHERVAKLIGFERKEKDEVFQQRDQGKDVRIG